MTKRFEPEAIDLAAVAEHLRTTVGSTTPGPVVGRTLLRDEVARHLVCSLLEAEALVDTMVARGFIVRIFDGPGGWRIA